MSDLKEPVQDRPAAGFGGCIAREKYWDEKSADEKLRTLGEVVDALYRKSREQELEITILRGHVHGANGDLFVPVNQKNETRDRFPFGYEHNPLNRERAR